MSEEEQKYFKGLIGFTFDSDDIRYIEKIVDKKDKEIEKLNIIIDIKTKRIQQLMKRTRSARIDKALEYIDENYLDVSYTYEKGEKLKCIVLDKIKEILKGDSSNE